MYLLQSVLHVAPKDAQNQRSRSHACSSAKSVVLNACVFHRELMGTRNSALATINGRPREEDPNALEDFFHNFIALLPLFSLYYITLYLPFCFSRKELIRVI
jgi:hypothetical protein